MTWNIKCHHDTHELRIWHVRVVCRFCYTSNMLPLCWNKYVTSFLHISITCCCSVPSWNLWSLTTRANAPIRRTFAPTSCSRTLKRLGSRWSDCVACRRRGYTPTPLPAAPLSTRTDHDEGPITTTGRLWRRTDHDDGPFMTKDQSRWRTNRDEGAIMMKDQSWLMTNRDEWPLMTCKCGHWLGPFCLVKVMDSYLAFCTVLVIYFCTSCECKHFTQPSSYGSFNVYRWYYDPNMAVVVVSCPYHVCQSTV